MCYVIITCKSMLWTILTILSTLLITAAIISPTWLIGQPQRLYSHNFTNAELTDKDRTFNPTLGVFKRCTKIHRYREVLERENCAIFVSGYDMSDDEFPHAWKAALVLFCVGEILLVFTMITSVISLCARSMCGKSIFTMSGLIQSVAGLFFIIGLLLYPAGWGTARVKRLCGDLSEPFYMDNCSFDVFMVGEDIVPGENHLSVSRWSFYVCCAGTIMVFVCAVLSIKADSSTSSQKVEEEVLEGKNLICVL